MEDLKLRHVIIENETLILKGKMNVFIGLDSNINNSIIEISIPTKRLSFAGSTFNNSKIILKKPLINMRWLYEKFFNCSFEGHFCGNDFGNWLTDEDRNGTVKDCDFSGANLDGCRFMNVDFSTIIFPKFPCFTIVNPVQNIDSIVHLHPYFQHLKRMFEGWLPDFTSAISYNAEMSEKDYIGNDLIGFKEIISKIDFIIT